jgi:NADPH:quinone reductase
MKPILDPHRYNLASVMDAYRAIEQGRAVGKVMIDIAD